MVQVVVVLVLLNIKNKNKFVVVLLCFTFNLVIKWLIHDSLNASFLAGKTSQGRLRTRLLWWLWRTNIVISVCVLSVCLYVCVCFFWFLMAAFSYLILTKKNSDNNTTVLVIWYVLYDEVRRLCHCHTVSWLVSMHSYYISNIQLISSC